MGVYLCACIHVCAFFVSAAYVESHIYINVIYIHTYITIYLMCIALHSGLFDHSDGDSLDPPSQRGSLFHISQHDVSGAQ